MNPSRYYGLLAETVEWDEDRSFIQFNMNPNAKWSDGEPLTADDVIFTFNLLKDKGRPPYNRRLNLVEKMEKVGENSVRFTFNADANRETPLIFALMPVLPQHAIDPGNLRHQHDDHARGLRPLRRRKGRARPAHRL